MKKNSMAVYLDIGFFLAFKNQDDKNLDNSNITNFILKRKDSYQFLIS